MRSRWSDVEAAEFAERYAAEWGEPLALRTYASRLLGAEASLVLHGGGNSSVKSSWRNVLAEEVPAIFVKASGVDLATIGPEGHPGLDLGYLLRLRAVEELFDEAMVDQLRTHLLRSDSANPSIEALVHAFLPATFVDHTHADAVLALTNRPDGLALAGRVMGERVVVLPYITPGFKLAKACVAALEAQPDAVGMVWGHHGLVTWGATARESYETMIDLVSRAEDFLESRRPQIGSGLPGAAAATAAAALQAELAEAKDRLARISPIVRGLLAQRTGDEDRPYRRAVLLPLTTPALLDALAAPGARGRFESPPLTTDHLIRTKALPLWVDGLDFENDEVLKEQLGAAVGAYVESYRAYVDRYTALLPAGMRAFDPRPRVVLVPGVGALCAGADLHEAANTRDITEHTLAVKALAGDYKGLPEEELFRMEYRTLQHAKLGGRGLEAPLRGHVALITGAAGAIGAGICEGLLESGCLVAATDLSGEPLDRLVNDLGAFFPGKILGVPLDVTDPESVAGAFSAVARVWGGVDLVIPNAGVALVCALTDLGLERYRKLEQVNVEGTLLVLSEAARMFKKQATGGDIVLISTKNVFAPGANFGAYSSTKAAAHQLARIASLELADDDVRVNMVAPDAVFSGGGRRSGLWAEVGPDRMKARGLDEAGLENYYQNRNLLKARVTAAHVAKAVLFFATRQTPTTGATIPVDGGLPDSTPR
jgi:rhamnose utilization protein RhaD (predicted bifunctional aldolase and dehydrogenase)/NAD(P)-dependent dehydrogenase (short-subunit alcohol dehydrogenase family)